MSALTPHPPLGVFRELRPWGYFEQYTHNDATTIKTLVLEKGQRLSLQMHEHRDEMWIVLSGAGRAMVGAREYPWITSTGTRMIWVPRRTTHRLMASDHEPLKVLEIAYGHFDESDIVRVEDDYGRMEAEGVD